MTESSEESANTRDRLKKSRLWCIDPIDGTREFIERNGQFVVMIGLAVQGVAHLGVLYQPTEDALLWGVVGQGAWLEQRGVSRALKVAPTTDIQRARMMVSRAHHSQTVERIAAQLGITQKQPMGSVGLKVAKIAQGEAEVYISASSQTHEWDACGPEAVLKAAGGQMTDIGGAPIVYNKPETNTPAWIMRNQRHPPCGAY